MNICCFVPGYQKLSWSKVVMDFQIIVHVRICPTVLFFIFFPHFAVMPKDFYAYLTNCVGVFRETMTTFDQDNF
jgi:hypothetical protein